MRIHAYKKAHRSLYDRNVEHIFLQCICKMLGAEKAQEVDEYVLKKAAESLGHSRTKSVVNGGDVSSSMSVTFDTETCAIDQ